MSKKTAAAAEEEEEEDEEENIISRASLLYLDINCKFKESESDLTACFFMLYYKFGES